MSRETLGVLVMLNNYFHDLAAALLFCSVLAAWVLWRRWGKGSGAEGALVVELVNALTRVAAYSLVWIVLGGVVRTLAYGEFEWMSAAGKGQVLALVLKHVILVSTVAAGVILLLDLRARTRPRAKEE